MRTKLSSKTSIGKTARAMVAGAALAVALGAASAAQAGDFCFDAGLWSFVGKGFHVPAKGKCKPFIGFKVYTPASKSYVVNGSACTPIAGDFVDLDLVSQTGDTTDAMFESVRLPLHSGTAGTYRMQRPNGINSSIALSEPGVPCPAPKLYTP